jgi:predicted nucleic acid-binding protein
MDAIDPDLLPFRALIDTGVALRAFFSEEPDFAADPRTPSCVAFVRAMSTSGRTCVMATITMAEALRYDGERQFPRYRGFEIGAFDDVAARAFGEKLSDAGLKQVQAETGGKRRTVSIDALIVATAVRYRVECIVSLDENDMPKVAELAGLPTRAPAHYFGRQTKLL